MADQPHLTSKDIYPFHEFVSDFARWVKDGHDLRYCFVLGAGASFTSGIPTGGSLVDGWLSARFEQACPGCPREEMPAWAERTFNHWPGFSWAKRAAFYGQLYEWFYRDNATGQAALRKLIKGKSPSFGYSVLAHILAKTEHRVVITTNFDNLVRDALAFYPEADPFICHGEADAPYLAGHTRHPRIVKVHGDIDRATYNTASQIKQLAPAWDGALRAIFTDHTPIFLGYGGNDPGFMRFLNDGLEAGAFPARPIWAYRVSGGGAAASADGVPPGVPDNDAIEIFRTRHRGFFLPIPGFDEFMLLLGHQLGVGNQSTLIRSDADRRAQDYERTLADAIKQTRLVPCDNWCPQLAVLAKQAEAALLGEEKYRTWDEWRVALRAAPTPQEKEGLFTKALAELKESPEAKAAYAAFIAGGSPRDPRIDSLLTDAQRQAEVSGGPESVALLTVKHQRSVVLRLRGQFEEAAKLAQDVLRGRERVLGLEHPDTLRSLNTLANSLSEKGDAEGAEALYRRALEIRERVLGPEHQDTLGSLNNLANLLMQKGDAAGAEPLYRRALATQERVLGLEHPQTLQTVGNLANLLVHKGDAAGAELLYRRALATHERVLGLEHPQTLQTVGNLAAFLMDRGDMVGAEPLCRRALSAQERVLGPEHRDTLASLNNLASLLGRKGDSAGAEPLYRRALATQERVLGLEHPQTLASAGNLAVLLMDRGDMAGAEPLCRRALSAQERVLGPEHRETLTSLNNLANLLGRKGDLAGAEPLHWRALETRERVLGPEHPDTLTSLNNLAALLDARGEVAGAIGLMQRAADGARRTLGEDHPTTKCYKSRLAALQDLPPPDEAGPAVPR